MSGGEAMREAGSGTVGEAMAKGGVETVGEAMR
jgi:hypothetical protein